MKTVIYDKINDRTITKDYEKHSLLIEGDYSTSSLTTYWVVNKFNSDKPCGIFITRESAISRKEFLNKNFQMEIYIIIQKTIFI